jgi:hypothetical protein
MAIMGGGVEEGVERSRVGADRKGQKRKPTGFNVPYFDLYIVVLLRCIKEFYLSRHELTRGI